MYIYIYVYICVSLQIYQKFPWWWLHFFHEFSKLIWLTLWYSVIITFPIIRKYEIIPKIYQELPEKSWLPIWKISSPKISSTDSHWFPAELDELSKERPVWRCRPSAAAMIIHGWDHQGYVAQVGGSSVEKTCSAVIFFYSYCITRTQTMIRVWLRMICSLSQKIFHIRTTVFMISIWSYESYELCLAMMS